jgi:hypothetical protein
VQGTAEFHHEITDALLPEAEPIFHAATALDTAIDMLSPASTMVQGLVGELRLSRQCLTAGLLRGHAALDLGPREGQEAHVLQQPTPRG